MPSILSRAKFLVHPATALMAQEMLSSIWSLEAPSFFAPAKWTLLHFVQPATTEAARATRCETLGSREPSLYLKPPPSFMMEPGMTFFFAMAFFSLLSFSLEIVQHLPTSFFERPRPPMSPTAGGKHVPPDSQVRSRGGGVRRLPLSPR